MILVSTSVPAPMPDALVFDGADKLAHVLLYGVLGLLTMRSAWPGDGPWSTLVLVVLGVSLFGALDEWHQSLTPWRRTDPLDWLADTVGAAAGAMIMAALRLHREQHREPSS